MLSYFKYKKWNFIIPTELTTSFQDAWRSKQPVAIPSELHLEVRRGITKSVDNILKDIEIMEECNSKEVFAKFCPLLVPDLDLKTPIHLISSPRVKKSTLARLQSVLKNHSFTKELLEDADFTLLITVFMIIDDEHLQINEENISNKYLFVSSVDDVSGSEDNEQDVQDCALKQIQTKTSEDQAQRYATEQLQPATFFEDMLKMVAERLSENDYFNYYDASFSKLHLQLKKTQSISIEELVNQLKTPSNNPYLPDYNMNTIVHILLERGNFKIVNELCNHIKSERNQAEAWKNSNLVRERLFQLQKDKPSFAENLEKYNKLSILCDDYTLYSNFDSTFQNEFISNLEFLEKEFTQIIQNFKNRQN